MAVYKIYMRSFAPWREFGELKGPTTVYVPVPPRGPVPYPFPPAVGIKFGGGYHGDGRGFSLDTTSPSVTARVNAVVAVDMNAGTKVSSKAWCDESRGPPASPSS
jgi:hypothetical protein